MDVFPATVCWERIDLPPGLQGGATAYKALVDIPGFVNAGDIVVYRPITSDCTIKPVPRVKYILKG